uniref:Uncharacterized protein n=1 Tax=Anguilla anguilla TaxID=7936 RepID=A0A0E9QWB5_ANGAN
MWQLYLNTNK